MDMYFSCYHKNKRREILYMKIDIDQFEKWVTNAPEGIPISKVLNRLDLPCTNENKLILLSLLKYHPSLTINYHGNTVIVLSS